MECLVTAKFSTFTGVAARYFLDFKTLLAKASKSSIFL